jgi:hypothetical protein
MNKIFDEYEARVAGFERDAATVAGVDREMLAVGAGQFAQRLRGALWTSSEARERGEGLAARAAKVERTLLEAALA